MGRRSEVSEPKIFLDQFMNTIDDEDGEVPLIYIFLFVCFLL